MDWTQQSAYLAAPTGGYKVGKHLKQQDLMAELRAVNRHPIKALPSSKDVGFSIGRWICSQLSLCMCVRVCGGENEMPRYLYQQGHLSKRQQGQRAGMMRQAYARTTLLHLNQ